VEWLLFRNWSFGKIGLYDLDRKEAERFGRWLHDARGVEAEVQRDLEHAVRDASLILFTTTASAPYFADAKLFAHCPTVLHLSLRDIGTNVILASQNVVDDVEHCLKASTSLHLTEMATGNRDFVAGNLVDVLESRVELDRRKPRIFSPFGLGVLDLAVGNFVLETAISSKATIALPDFFSNSARW
jgi:ornithine cyclodeaminase